MQLIFHFKLDETDIVIDNFIQDYRATYKTMEMIEHRDRHLLWKD